MIRVQNKISTGLDVLQFFTMRNWVFLSQKFKDLNKQLSPEEYKMFFVDTEAVPDSFEDQFIKNCFLGGRQYVLKEPMSSIPKARIQMKMWENVEIWNWQNVHALKSIFNILFLISSAYVVDRVCKFFFFYFLVKFLLNIFGLMPFVESFFTSSSVNDAIEVQ